MTREEALKIVRENYPHFGTTEPWLDLEKALATLIPELAESEDERIRAVILKLVLGMRDEIFTTADKLVTKPKVLAWLEKQKYDRMKPVYDARESFESALAKAWNDYHNGYENVDKLEDDYVECAHAKGFREGYLFGLEKQKENPKSADSIPSDCVSDAKCEDRSPKHSDSDGTDIRDTPAYWKGWDDAMKQKEQKHPNSCFTCDEYKKGYESGRLNGFTAGYNKAMKKVEQKEQKPVDDKSFEEWVNDWWKHHKVNNPDSYDKGDEIQFDERGFKNFCRGIKNMYAEQKRGDRFEEARKKYQVEWSGEDENTLENLHELITFGFTEKFFDAQTTVDIRKWLNTRLKSLRPSWKPSEEQIYSLGTVVKGCGDCTVGSVGYNLKELYEQLKKLI